MINNSLLGWVSLVMIFSFSIQLAVAQAQGAKGLYLEQMNEPTKNINTGIQYWIELNRNGTIHQVSNKFAFRSGDQIKFHVKANIDGYAYIVLKSGSRGEQSILFPESGEDNQVARGKDYAMPQDGYLAFDQNPGLEKVALLVSRTPVAPSAYLHQPQEMERAVIASAAAGAKDLIPSKILLSYTPAATMPPKVVVSATPQLRNPQPKQSSKQIAIKRKPKAAHRQQALEKARENEPVMREETTHTDALEAGVVTVVYKDPVGILALEVDLQHI